MQQFEKLLRTFPFSQREQPQSVVIVQAIDNSEPPLLERPMNGPIDVSELLPLFRDFEGEDVAYSVDSWWDVWQFDTDWKLAPARVQLSCFGPEFDSGSDEGLEDQEDLRIDFGIDAHYLPPTDVPGGANLIASNIKSLLRLVHEIDTTLPVRKRHLQTESGENFAERLQQVLAGAGSE